MTAPSWIGSKVADYTGSAVTSVVLDPSSPTSGAAVATGDFLLLTIFGAAGAAMSDPSGWTLIAKQQQGTRHGGIYYRVRQSGDSSYTITVPSSNGVQGTLSWFRGVHPSLTGLVLGTLTVRTVSGSTTTCASITTTAADSLVVSVGLEATTATATPAPTATFGSQAMWAPETTSPQIHTTYVNTFVKTTAGATGTNTLTYTQASANGYGVQIALPPAPSTNTPPTAAFSWVRTGRSVAFHDDSTDPDGTVSAWSWTFGDSATSTSQHPTHSYAAGAGSYTAALTVTDDDSDTGNVSHTVTLPATDETSGGHVFYDSFARYSDGTGPVGKTALTGQTWALYSGPDEIVGGYYDSADLTAAYPYVVATDEVTRFGCRFRWDTHSGALTTSGSIILSIWDDITAVATRKSRCHMILTPTAAQLTVYPSSSPTSLGSASFSTSQDADHTMEVVLSGTNAKLYVDGTLRLNLTDALIADQGMRHVVWEPYYNNSATASRVRIAETWADWGPVPITGTLTASAPTATAGPPTAAVTGSVTVPTSTGTISAQAPTITAGVPTAAISGTVTAPLRTGTLSAAAPAATAGPPTSTWSGTVTPPLFAGTLVASAPAITAGPPTASISGVAVAPGGGIIAASLPTITAGPPTAAWSGTVAPPAPVLGVLSATAPAIVAGVPVATITGATVVPVWHGTLNAAAPAITVAVPVSAWTGRLPGAARDITLTVTGPTGHPMRLTGPHGHPMTLTGPEA